MSNDTLWVVSVISNPVQYRSRYKLYREFEQRVLKAGANLMTVELSIGGRDFEVTEHGHERHLQLRARDELWHKELMINLGVQYLPESWQYVAWIDADIAFTRDDWVQEIVNQLQHYKLLQLFRDAIDLGPNGEFLTKHSGFIWAYLTGQPMGTSGRYGYQGHPGYGWACRRETWNELGGLIDFAVLGSADHHMAWALLGQALERAPGDLSAGYKQGLKVWQDRAQLLNRDVGYMDGTITHYWHGRKKDRRYQDRWKILLKHNFDPTLDLQRDWQGVLQLSHRGERMREDLRGYFRARSEDSIDL